MENGKGCAWAAPTINILYPDKSDCEGYRILAQQCDALRTDVSNLQRRVGELDKSRVDHHADEVAASNLQRRVGELEKTRVDHQVDEAAAVLCQLAINIEHKVKAMVVAHVGPQKLTAIYSARTKSIDKYVLKNTMVTTLLDHAFDALTESDYYKMQADIFPYGVDLFVDTMYHLKRFSDAAHPTTYKNAPLDLKTAKNLIEHMLPRDEDSTRSSLEKCKTEGISWLNVLAMHNPSAGDLLQRI